MDKPPLSSGKCGNAFFPIKNTAFGYRLMPTDNPRTKPLDVSEGILRDLSPINRHHCRNMRIDASVSF